MLTLVAALAASAASVASTASAASGGRRGPLNLDFAPALPWLLPLLLATPAILLLLMAIGVRGRRSSANVALFGVALAAALLAAIAYARAGQGGAYDASYTWLSLTLSFTGASQFQTYTPALALRINHINLLLLGVALAVALGTIAWSRAGARGEPALTRYYGLHLLLLFGALGVVLSLDLAALYAFWGLAGIASYLLLTHNWADDRSTAAARLALALPVIGDLALLAGIGILYSRYGNLNLDGLIPILQTTAGAGPKALATASILLFAGAALRLGLFPFHGWVTMAGESPPGAAAAVHGMWPVMAAALMYKTLPIMVAWTPLPLRVAAVVASVSAVVLPLLALAGQDARRVAGGVGVALSALALLAFARPALVGPAALALAATGPARAALALASAALVTAMRSPVLADMGEGWRRMRRTIAGVGLAVVALALVPGQAAGSGLRWWWFVAYGLGLGIATLAASRLVFGPALLPIVRRRGFEPGRVRDPAGVMTLPVILLGLATGLLAVSSFSTRWLTWIDGKSHDDPAVWATALWLVVPAVALLLGFLLIVRLRSTTASLLGRLSSAYGLALASLYGFGERFLAAPTLALARGADDVALEAGEGRLGADISASAALASSRLPLVPLALGLAVLAVVLFALLAPGVYR